MRRLADFRHEAEEVAFGIAEEGHPELVIRHFSEHVGFAFQRDSTRLEVRCRRMNISSFVVEDGAMGGSVLLGPGEHEADTSDVEKSQAGDFEEELEAERSAVEGDGAGNVLNSDGDLPKGGGFKSHEGEYIATSDLDASDGAGVEVESGGPPRQNEGTDGRAMFGRGGLDKFVELYEFTEALAEDLAGENASDPGQSDGFEHFVRPELSPDRRPEHGQTLGFPPEDVEGYWVSLFRQGADYPRQFGYFCPGPV